MGFSAFCGKDIYKYVSNLSPVPVIMVGYRCAVATLLAFATLAFASEKDNSLQDGERVFLGTPVVAPPSYTSGKVADFVRQRPIAVPQTLQSFLDSRKLADKSLEKPQSTNEQVILQYSYIFNVRYTLFP